jgi:CubicO group peptidase (beta-lactamase class C family)
MPSLSGSLEALAEAAFAPVREAVAAGRIPGAALGVITRAGERAVLHEGMAQLVPERRPLARDTWFDLASLTKVMFTTTRILDLAARGRIDLDAPLTSVMPDFRQYHAGAWERQVTFRQCLGHQTPFPAVEPLYTYGQDPATLRAFVLQREWRAGPAAYSDINFILLGIALERIEDRTMRDFALPSGLGWRSDPTETAATEHCFWRGRVMVGEVHDENSFALQGSGHAGLFGTIDGVLDFARGLLDGSGAATASIELMRRPLSANRTHGWERPGIGWSGGDGCGPGVIGHTGFTGTGLWIDFDAGLGWSLLTNRVHPSRHADSGIFALRRAVGDIVSHHLRS